MPHRLSKSRYTAGVQCHKLLWWKVHEPMAVELQPGKVLQDRFDQGAQVGALARDRFPGGVLVELPYYAVDERVTLTRKLIADGAPAIFEASALADNTFVAVDVLTPQDGGFHLTEVKSSSSQKVWSERGRSAVVFTLKGVLGRHCPEGQPGSVPRGHAAETTNPEPNCSSGFVSRVCFGLPPDGLLRLGSDLMERRNRNLVALHLGRAL